MIDDDEKKNEELEVNLDEVETEKEVDVPLNPLEKLQQQQEEPSKDEDKSYENERQIRLDKAPAYSDDMPYSVKVRKRIQKEVAKRAEAEQRSVDLEEKLAMMEKRTYDIANKSLSNQLSSVSSRLKSAIEEGNTDEQVKLYESMAEIRSQITKTEDYAARIPQKEKTRKKDSAFGNRVGKRKLQHGLINLVIERNSYGLWN